MEHGKYKVDIPGGSTLENLIMFSGTQCGTRWQAIIKSTFIITRHLKRPPHKCQEKPRKAVCFFFKSQNIKIILQECPDCSFGVLSMKRILLNITGVNRH